MIAQDSSREFTTFWHENSSDFDPQHFRGSPIDSGLNLVYECRLFVKQKLSQFFPSNSDLHLEHRSKNLIGYHITLYQSFEGKRVIGSEVKLNLNMDLEIRTTFVKLVNPETKRIVENEQLQHDNAWVLFEDEMRNAFVQYTETESGTYQVIDFGEGEVLMKNLDRHATGPIDSMVWAYVYNPDPLTASRTSYGGQFKNFGDSTNESLDAARELVQVPMKFQGDSFWVSNSYVKVFSHKGGFITSKTDTFDFTRDQDEFESVNVLYHITEYRKYLETIGLEDALAYRITVNPRAFLGDQSRFSPSVQNKREGTLSFGYSNAQRPHVDDAEDADVIIHELGHGISRYMNGTNNSALDRVSLDEGFGDYLACGYSKDIDSYNWEKLFSWDGHNEFWDTNLRYCETDRTMADFIFIERSNHDKYLNGEIFAGMAMDFRNRISGEKADQIVISAASSFGTSMKFADVAYLLMDAEEALFEKQYAGALCSVLELYGFVEKDYCVVSIPEDISRKFLVNQVAFQSNRLEVNNLPISQGLVTLYTMHGQIVHQGSFTDAISTQLQKIDPGVYLLQLSQPEIGFKAVQRVVRY